MAGLASRSDTEGIEGRKNDWKGGRKTPLVSRHTEEGKYACFQVALVCQGTDLGSTGRSVLYCRMPPHNATGPPYSPQARSTPPTPHTRVAPLSSPRNSKSTCPSPRWPSGGPGYKRAGPKSEQEKTGKKRCGGLRSQLGAGTAGMPCYRPGSSLRVSNNLSPSGAGTAPSCGSGGEPNSPVTGTWLHRRWGPAQTRPRPNPFLSALPFQNCRTPTSNSTYQASASSNVRR